MYKIILVDDDILTLESLKNALPWQKYSFEITASFSNSLKAVEYIENNRPDVVITDIKMPKPDGVELARLCFENFPDIKVVLVSAYRDFEYAQQALKYNVTRYITKPIDYDECCAVLKSISEALEKKDDSPQFLENEDFEKRNHVFADLLGGLIDTPEKLYKELKDVKIDINVLTTPCILVNFHMLDFDNYLKSVWKHGRDKLYNAINYLAPPENERGYFVFSRYFRNNLEWAILPKNEISLEEDTLLEDFTAEFLGNIKNILNIDSKITFFEKYSSISELIRKRAKTPLDQPDNSIITAVYDYISKNYGENITLNDVAAHVSMNASYLSVYFKQETGKKFIDTLTEYRISKAAELLLNTDYKISAIGDMVGYRGMTHFYNIFKHYYNDTPAGYRSKNSHN